MKKFQKTIVTVAVGTVFNISSPASLAESPQGEVKGIQATLSVTAATATETNVWLDAHGINIILPGVQPDDVTDFEWNGTVITHEIEELIYEGLVAVSDKYGDLLITIASEQAERFNGGQVGVVLANGTRIVVPLVQDLAPLDGESFTPFQHKSQASYTVLAGTTNCNKYYSSGNPYPCCDNDGGGVTGVYNGNCTWWAWDKMKTN